MLYSSCLWHPQTSLQHYPQFTYYKKQNWCESRSYGWRGDFLDVSSRMKAETYDKCLPPRSLHRHNSIELTGSFRPVLLRKQAVTFLLAGLWVLWACLLFVCIFFFPKHQVALLCTINYNNQRNISEMYYMWVLLGLQPPFFFFFNLNTSKDCSYLQKAVLLTTVFVASTKNKDTRKYIFLFLI